jgi:hypothetical protein
MRPETLRDVGEALYGSEWKAPLATALDVNYRNVRRWAAGDKEIPPNIVGDLVDLCRQAQADLGELIRIMEADDGL